MATARIRFYEELNDFLPQDKRKREFECHFLVPGSVKDMIENLGVPHTEIDLILVNGESVDFGYQVQDGDQISVYPMFESLDIAPVTRLRPEPLREPRFVLDCHLGQLARYLRMLGFDCLYRNDYDDERLLELSLRDDRILLTRDLGLLKRRDLTRGYFVRATNPQAQIREIIRRMQLENNLRPFARCMECNSLLEAVDKAAIEHRLEPETRRLFNDFRRCPACRRIYWPGSHFDRMQTLIEQIAR